MRVAFTGSSSTGKTTLADRLRSDIGFRQRIPGFITTDARALLRSMGHTSMDKMSHEERRSFQEHYLSKKLELENGRDDYLTDRSFVDVAAYWIERDAVGLPLEQREPLIEQCRRAALRYDVHIYFPFGLVPFQSDGYRSEDYGGHVRIDERIRTLLAEWKVEVLCLDMANLDERASLVLQALAARQ